MRLFQTNRPYFHAIAIRIFCVYILQSSTLIAASAETDDTSPPFIPAVAMGHEAEYQRFLAGRLEYRPDPEIDDGMVVLFFRDILESIARTDKPLSATFDLSGCGDLGQHISIHTAYKEIKIPANAGKTEIWICPRFLVEKEFPASLAPTVGQWEAPVGYFWTGGGQHAKTENYEYLLGKSVMNNRTNLCEKWSSRVPRTRYYAPLPEMQRRIKIIF